MAYNQSTNVYGPVSQTKLVNITKTKPKFFGMNFPIGKFAKSGGFFNNTTGIETIRSGIQQLLQTERGERVMLPLYGCNLKKFLFQQLDDITFNEIKDEIGTSIRNYTRDVEVIKLNVFSLDKITETGGQALKIILLLRLTDDARTQFEVEVVLL